MRFPDAARDALSLWCGRVLSTKYKISRGFKYYPYYLSHGLLYVLENTPAAAPEAPKLIPLDFHVEVTLEQAKALQRFLVENNIKYSKI